MPERPFICTPSSWIYDPGINQLEEHEECFFRRLASCTNADWRFSADLDIIQGECLAKRRNVRRKEVERRLDKMAALGLIVFFQASGKRWLQIAEHLQYHRDAHMEDRWAVEPPQQTELPMAVPLKPAAKKQPPRKPAPAPAAAPAAEEPTDEDGLTEADRIMGALGSSQLLGMVEAVEHADKWRKRIAEDRVAMLEAIGDLQMRLLNKLKPVANRGAWLTDRYERIRADRQNGDRRTA